MTLDAAEAFEPGWAENHADDGLILLHRISSLSVERMPGLLTVRLLDDESRVRGHPGKYFEVHQVAGKSFII